MEHIENLTIKEAKEKINEYKNLLNVFNMKEEETNNKNNINSEYIGRYVIVRTYSAGVWFGKVLKKEGNEIILGDAKRMFYWEAKKSISLSAVARYGLTDSSRICPKVKQVWLQPIELIDCEANVIEQIKNFAETEQR